jgi:uncharacterized linocin/CFP29 family protein
MPDFIQRDQAPLTSGQWTTLDEVVVGAARSILVGRRVIPVVGPFGAGIQALPSDTLSGTGAGQIDLLGNEEGDAIGLEARRYLPVPLLYKDFWLYWRDLEASNQLGLPLDTSRAAAAAGAVARAEDTLVLDGHPGLGLPGLRTVEGHQSVDLGDWGVEGQGFAAVVNAARQLSDRDFPGPYALIVSTGLYAQLNRLFGNTGVLEIDQVAKLARRGVYATSVLPEPAALLVDSGAQHMDLAISIDLVTAYVESVNLNHHFRVVESLLLRIHRPDAICTFEA